MASGLGERRQVSGAPGPSIAVSVLQHGFGAIGAPAAFAVSSPDDQDVGSPMSTGDYIDAERVAEIASLVDDGSGDERRPASSSRLSGSSVPKFGISRDEDWHSVGSSSLASKSSKPFKDGGVWGGSSLFADPFPGTDLGFASLAVSSSPPVGWGKIRSAPLFEEPKVPSLEKFVAISSPRHSRSKTSDFGMKGLDKEFFKITLDKLNADPSSDYSAGSGDEEVAHQARSDAAMNRLFISSSARESLSTLATEDLVTYSKPPTRLERPESAPADRVPRTMGFPRSKSSLSSKGLAIGAKEFVPSGSMDDLAGSEKRIKFGDLRVPDQISPTSESISSSSKHSRVSFGSASQIDPISSAKRKRPSRLSGDLKDMEVDAPAKPKSALAGHRRSVSDRSALKFATEEMSGIPDASLLAADVVIPKVPLTGPVLAPSRSRERKPGKGKKAKSPDSEKHHRAKSTGSYSSTSPEGAPLKMGVSLSADAATQADAKEDHASVPSEFLKKPPTGLRPKSVEEKKTSSMDHRRAKSDGAPLKEVMDPLDYMNSDVHVPKHVLLFKTELCRAYLKTGFCKYGDSCHFAHGIAEVRGARRHPKFKTEKCKMYHEKGSCPFGDTCAFIHEEAGPTLEHIRSDIAAELSKTFAGDQVVDVEVEVKKPVVAAPIGPKKT